MTDILFIRHGETAWNAVRRLQGHLDIHLSAEGRRQAKALAAALEGEKLAAIICSDLQRAVQTAGEIARLQGLPTRLEQQLRERCFGDFEGKLYSELPELYPNEYAQWRTRDPDFHFPAKPDEPSNRGESTREFDQRIRAALQHYAKQYAGKKIALVAHGGVLECAYRLAMQLPLNAERSVTIYNASINRFHYHDGRLSLINWGERGHLEVGALDEVT